MRIATVQETAPRFALGPPSTVLQEGRSDRSGRIGLLLLRCQMRVNGGGCFCAQVFRSPKYSSV